MRTDQRFTGVLIQYAPLRLFQVGYDGVVLTLREFRILRQFQRMAMLDPFAEVVRGILQVMKIECRQMTEKLEVVCLAPMLHCDFSSRMTRRKLDRAAEKNKSVFSPFVQQKSDRIFLKKIKTNW